MEMETGSAGVRYAVSRRTLLIGIGNSGRSDDGLGWAFAEAVENMPEFAGDVVMRYQLQIEDAHMIAPYDLVIFVDATKETLEEGFGIEPLSDGIKFNYTSHALEPSAVHVLCNELYDTCPQSLLLKISGSSWGLSIGLSEEARANLARAVEYFRNAFLSGKKPISLTSTLAV